jgi:hypothetical protein
MPITTVFECSLSIDSALVVAYFFKGEKKEDPALFLDLNPGLSELAFLSPEETQNMINKCLIHATTHKPISSEYGFNLVFR